MSIVSDASLRISNPAFASFLAVMACDFVFAAYFTFKPKGRPQRARSAPLSVLGIALQSIACWSIGILHRSPTKPLFPMPVFGTIAIGAVAVALAVASAWLAIAAVVTLGKQWTYVAKIGEGHQLITRGPYALLRHPIYASMTGLVIASALTAARWWAAPIAITLQCMGSWIRIRQEDRLLLETHGEAFASYAARVPAIIPRLRHASRVGDGPA